MMASDWARVLQAGSYGDAVGYVVEFDSWESIRSTYGNAGVGAFKLKERPASDDTQMTLFACHAFAGLAPGFSPAEYARSCQEAFLSWLRTQRSPGPLRAGCPLEGIEAFRKRRAPGNTCLSALAALDAGGTVGSVGSPANNSKGCGAAMRAAPCAAPPHWGLAEAFEAGVAQGAITHGHPDGYGSAGAFAALCKGALDGMRLEAAAREAIKMADRIGAVGSAERMGAALALAGAPVDPEDMGRLLGEGWVGDEALGIALWAAMAAGSLFEAACLGANHSGDSDSTASMACQLWALANKVEAPGERALLDSSDLAIHCVLAASWLPLA